MEWNYGSPLAVIALEVQLVKPGGHCRGEKEKEEKLGGSCQLEPRDTRNTDGGEKRERKVESVRKSSNSM